MDCLFKDMCNSVLTKIFFVDFSAAEGNVVQFSQNHRNCITTQGSV